jgi:hypothetical protein
VGGVLSDEGSVQAPVGILEPDIGAETVHQLVVQYTHGVVQFRPVRGRRQRRHVAEVDGSLQRPCAAVELGVVEKCLVDTQGVVSDPGVETRDLGIGHEIVETGEEHQIVDLSMRLEVLGRYGLTWLRVVAAVSFICVIVARHFHERDIATVSQAAHGKKDQSGIPDHGFSLADSDGEGTWEISVGGYLAAVGTGNKAAQRISAEGVGSCRLDLVAGIGEANGAGVDRKSAVEVRERPGQDAGGNIADRQAAGGGPPKRHLGRLHMQVTQ